MKILVTDDSENWVQHHISCLKSFLPKDTEFDKANWAKDGLDKVMFNIDEPYNIIFTDMQMEGDFLPLYAGEWFIRQIKTFKEYSNTSIVIISAAPDIKKIAEKYNVKYIPKRMCQSIKPYKEIFNEVTNV